MELLRGVVRPYAWGSRIAIPELQGRPVPAPHPEAELWMGAHPADSSLLIAPDGQEQSLCAAIKSDPIHQLGQTCAARWDNKLPFLLKVLAAQESLSLQAHPSAEQAARGYEREEKAGIPRDAPHRNYPDPTAKPELLCALTEFHALAGFRNPLRTVELLQAIATPGLAKYSQLLAAQPDSAGLRALFTTWITLPQSILDALLPEVLDACILHVKERGEFDTECRTILELGEAHPRDAGVLAALLLNRLTLAPGEAIYLPAGNLHLYLHGTAMEILANSDNTLRCGLTSKYVDVPELLRVVDFSAGDMPVLSGEPDVLGAVYRTDAEEFELSRLEWHPNNGADEVSTTGGSTTEISTTGGQPQIFFCSAGSVLVHANDGTRFPLVKGQAMWVAAGDPTVRLTPQHAEFTQVFRATTGQLAGGA